MQLLDELLGILFEKFVLFWTKKQNLQRKKNSILEQNSKKNSKNQPKKEGGEFSTYFPKWIFRPKNE